MFQGIGRASLAIMALELSGCMSAPYVPHEPQDSYPGKVVAKTQATNPNLSAELARADTEHDKALLMVAIGGAMGGVIGGVIMGSAGADAIFADQVRGEPYRYEIDTNANKRIVIFHLHGGFQVGDCVSILVGKETGKVSMAYGNKCTSNS